MEIEGEKAYPLYKMRIKWTEDIPEKYTTSDWQTKGLPEGRMHNGTSFYRMYKEEKDIDTLKQELKTEWWPRYLDAKAKEAQEDLYKTTKITNPELTLIEVTLERYETWCLRWFEHWTFDTGQTDEEALASFSRFVDRMTRLGEDKYCLMGAEDRWRWCGSQDGTSDTRTDPPCRCKYCKEQGVIRIGH